MSKLLTGGSQAVAHVFLSLIETYKTIHVFSKHRKKTRTKPDKNTEVSSSQLLKSKRRQQQDISQLFHFTKC